MSRAVVYRLENVAHRYGESFHLRIEGLDVVAGETLCLLGPTGAGKSTLLRLLSGLEAASEGGICFAGRLLRGDLPIGIQRKIAMVPQRPLMLHGSVRSNVEYGLRLRKARDHTKVEAVLQRLELYPLANRVAGTLSEGQMQLVALARALVLGPEVLLLDEPTAHLDPAHVGLVEAAIDHGRRQKPMTVVWATHNLFQARRIADRVGLLLAGQLVELAPAAEFFDRPTDPRTAAFVQGKMIY